MLKAEHVRYATGRQLADLLGVDPATVSRWDRGSRHWSLASLQPAVERGLPIQDILAALKARREDVERIAQAQRELDQILKIEKVAG